MERRNESRIELSLDILLAHHEELFRLQTIDLSKGGLFVNTESNNFKVGDCVDIAIVSSDENNDYFCVSSVWVIRKSTDGIALIDSGDNNLGNLLEQIINDNSPFKKEDLNVIDPSTYAYIQ